MLGILAQPRKRYPSAAVGEDDGFREGLNPSYGLKKARNAIPRFKFQTANLGCATAISRRDAPEVCRNDTPRKRGRGECRAHGAPAASCAKVECRAHTSSQVAPESPGIPARNGLTAYIVLSSVTGLSCHRHP